MRQTRPPESRATSSGWMAYGLGLAIGPKRLGRNSEDIANGLLDVGQADRMVVLLDELRERLFGERTVDRPL